MRLLAWWRKRKALQVFKRYGVCPECFHRLEHQFHGRAHYSFCRVCSPELSFEGIKNRQIEQAKRVLQQQ